MCCYLYWHEYVLIMLLSLLMVLSLSLLSYFFSLKHHGFHIASVLEKDEGCRIDAKVTQSIVVVISYEDKQTELVGHK